MSQQMHFDEEQRGYQAAYTPTLGENTGGYDQHSAQMPAQKIGWSAGERGASAGQRLALAIVSLVVLLGSLSVLSGSSSDMGQVVTKLMSMAILCIAVIAINFIFNFNWRRLFGLIV